MRLGKEQDLFSVRETSDGSLMLMFKATQSTFGTESLKTVLDLHTTIHTKRSHGREGRPANKVKYTLKTHDNDEYSGSLIVKENKRRGLLWPAANTLSALSFGPNGIKRSAKDTYIELIGYTFPTEILCYTIYGHSKDVTPPMVQGFNRLTCEFSLLNLTVYGTFLYLPNHPVALNTTPRNLPVRKNGEFVGAARELFVPTMSVNGIEKFLQRTHADIATLYLDLLTATVDRHRVGQLRQLPVQSLFNRWPAENDEIHTAYGVWSRYENEIYSAPNFVNGTRKPPRFREPLGAIRTAMNTPEALARHGVESRYEKQGAAKERA